MIKRLLVFGVICCVLIQCKEEEPFEFPEEPVDIKPELITEMRRDMKSIEDWQITRSVNNCNPNFMDENLAYGEINGSTGSAIIQLVPSGEGCELSLKLKSAILDDEISKSELEELNFEFTFSEYGSAEGASFPLSIYYKNLELDLDIAVFADRHTTQEYNDGVLELWFEDDKPNFTLNGNAFSPDFDKVQNHFSLGGDASENYISFGLASDGSAEQSYIVSQLIRITRFGVPD